MLPQEICIDHFNDFYTESELASSFGSLPPSTYSPSSWFSEFDFEGMEEQEAKFDVYTTIQYENDNGFKMTDHVGPGGVSVPAELLISEYLKSNPSHLTNCFSPPEPSTCSVPLHPKPLSVAKLSCGAFFRRSIADQKTYSCSTKDCDISQPRKHGTTCRYCRFQACILNGMLPNEVQCKRQKVQAQTSCSPPSSNSSSSSSSSFFPILTQPIQTTGEQHKFVGGHLHSQEENSGHESWPLQTTPHVQHKLQQFQAVFRRGNALVPKCRLRRPLIYKIFADNCQENQFDDAEKASNWNFCFWMWCLLESALTTLRYGGVQTGRIYFPDQGFLELQHEDFVEFFDAKFSRDASSLARLSLPIAEFFVENLCRSLQAERLGGEYECAALLALVLSGVISEQGSSTHSLNHASSSAKSRNVKRQIFSELLDHYTCSSPLATTHMPASKMGIVLLASSSLIEAVNMLKSCIVASKLWKT
uniref:Nuclear receptor domain-containing protein n=1 Tax=Ditylenchus dipsaci TaxID=166011 RepID=A0A915CQN2_9BILA